MFKTGVIPFFRDVRSEAKKVTWPSRNETLVTTGMVFLLVFIASLFFLFVDFSLQAIVRFALGLG